MSKIVLIGVISLVIIGLLVTIIWQALKLRSSNKSGVNYAVDRTSLLDSDVVNESLLDSNNDTQTSAQNSQIMEKLADLFAEGHDSKAIALLNAAIVNEPSNSKYHMMLLNLYVKHNDMDNFERIVDELHGIGNVEAIAKANKLRNQIKPTADDLPIADVMASSPLSNSSMSTMNNPVVDNGSDDDFLDLEMSISSHETSEVSLIDEGNINSHSSPTHQDDDDDFLTLDSPLPDSMSISQELEAIESTLVTNSPKATENNTARPKDDELDLLFSLDGAPDPVADEAPGLNMQVSSAAELKASLNPQENIVDNSIDFTSEVEDNSIDFSTSSDDNSIDFVSTKIDHTPSIGQDTAAYFDNELSLETAPAATYTPEATQEENVSSLSFSNEIEFEPSLNQAETVHNTPGMLSGNLFEESNLSLDNSGLSLEADLSSPIEAPQADVLDSLDMLAADLSTNNNSLDNNDLSLLSIEDDNNQTIELLDSNTQSVAEFDDFDDFDDFDALLEESVNIQQSVPPQSENATGIFTGVAAGVTAGLAATEMSGIREIQALTNSSNATITEEQLTTETNEPVAEFNPDTLFDLDDFDLSSSVQEGESLGNELQNNEVVAVNTEQPVEFDSPDLDFSLDTFADDAGSTQEVPTSQPEVLTAKAPVASAIDEIADKEFLAQLHSELNFVNDLDDNETNLELAANCISLGELSYAQSLVNDVLTNGSEQQKEQANVLLSKISV